MAGQPFPATSADLFSPQAPRRNPRPFDERCEFCPHDRRMTLVRAGERGEAAVCAGDHTLATDDVRKAGDALGDKLRMLDQHGRLGDDAGNEDLVVGYAGATPLLPLM